MEVREDTATVSSHTYNSKASSSSYQSSRYEVVATFNLFSTNKPFCESMTTPGNSCITDQDARGQRKMDRVGQYQNESTVITSGRRCDCLKVSTTSSEQTALQGSRPEDLERKATKDWDGMRTIEDHDRRTTSSNVSL